jgi:S-formylglutathione hydrolase
VSPIETISTNRSHGGTQGVYRHASAATGTNMTFSVFVPDGAQASPVVWFLSGLTCTHANVTEKGEFRAACAKHGLIFVAPDTSPRGDGVPDDHAGAYDFGLGAGFYLNATQSPYSQHYKMWDYITWELPALLTSHFPVDLQRQSIMGHSMGGHGALTIGLSFPERFRAVSAFSPIVAPSLTPWGQKALSGYLGNDRSAWRRHDAVSLIEDGARLDEVLIDQGDADPFVHEQLKPERFAEVCSRAGMKLTLKMRSGYDHSYYFISTFMPEQLRWHSERLHP